jgi:hypothetical protein
VQPPCARSGERARTLLSRPRGAKKEEGEGDWGAHAAAYPYFTISTPYKYCTVEDKKKRGQCYNKQPAWVPETTFNPAYFPKMVQKILLFWILLHLATLPIPMKNHLTLCLRLQFDGPSGQNVSETDIPLLLPWLRNILTNFGLPHPRSTNVVKPPSHSGTSNIDMYWDVVSTNVRTRFLHTHSSMSLTSRGHGTARCKEYL